MSKCNHMLYLTSEKHLACKRCAMRESALVCEMNVKMIECIEMRQMLALDRKYTTLDCLAILQKACEQIFDSHPDNYDSVILASKAAEEILLSSGYMRDDNGVWFKKAI